MGTSERTDGESAPPGRTVGSGGHPALASHPPELLAEILDAMPERVSRYRLADRVVVYGNRAWAAGHDREPADLLGRPLDDLLSPPEIEGMHYQLARLSRDDPLLTDPNPRQAPEDPTIWIEWVDLLMPSTDGDEVLSIGRDVTDRHQAQLRLRASEARFRSAMDSAPSGMMLIGLDGRLIEVNPAFCRFLGYAEDQLLGQRWQNLVHPDDLAADQARVDQLFAGSLDDYTAELRWLHADGSVRWSLQSGTLVRDTDGTPLHGLAQVVDITARKQAESEARWLAEQLTTTLDSIQDGVVHLEADWTFGYASSRGAQILGRPVDELIGRNIWKVFPRLVETPSFTATVRAMEERIAVEMPPYFDAQLGTWFELDAHPSSRGIVVFFRDVTDRVERERQLEQALQVEQDAADRLARGTLRAERVQLDAAEVIRVAAKEGRDPARLQLDLPPSLHASVDPTQLHRIVSNLVDNAHTYAPTGPIRVRAVPLVMGGVRVEVSDRGPGIPRQERQRVFEPFHRVERSHPQPGTGVGLALVADFARLHGGRAWVEPADPTGTRIIVELPDQAPDSHR